MRDRDQEISDLWPPNSPDLNPTDYKIWNIIQQRVYQTKVQDVNDLMQCLIDVWAGVEPSVIDDATDQRCKRLYACLRATVGYFEY